MDIAIKADSCARRFCVSHLPSCSAVVSLVVGSRLPSRVSPPTAGDDAGGAGVRSAPETRRQVATLSETGAWHGALQSYDA